MRNQGLNPDDLQQLQESFLNRRSVFLLSPQSVEIKTYILKIIFLKAATMYYEGL
jgi:hypothetical protein